MNVIFDMDGFMFDTERVFIKAWDYAGEKIGIGKAGFMVYKTYILTSMPYKYIITSIKVNRKQRIIVGATQEIIKMAIPLKLDITTGDEITPKEIEYQFKLFLSFATIVLSTHL